MYTSGIPIFNATESIGENEEFPGLGGKFQLPEFDKTPKSNNQI